MAGALVAIWVVFSIATGGTFLVPRNLSLLARQMSVTSILAVGMVLVVVALGRQQLGDLRWKADDLSGQLAVLPGHVFDLLREHNQDLLA